MKHKWECAECGQEIESATKPTQPCKCGARGTWVKVTQGTPKTLLKAVRDGLPEGGGLSAQLGLDCEALRIQAHVVDYLAQKFTVAAYSTSDQASLEMLWAKITGQEWPKK